MTQSSRVSAIVLIASAALMGWSLLRSPKRVVLARDCEPTSALDRARASIQGARFWSAELHAIDSEIQMWLRLPKQMAAVDVQVAGALSESQRMMESIYVAHPEIAPSSGKRAADELRRQADAVEQAEMQAKLDSIGLKRVDDLLACRATVEQRAR